MLIFMKDPLFKVSVFGSCFRMCDQIIPKIEFIRVAGILHVDVIHFFAKPAGVYPLNIVRCGAGVGMVKAQPYRQTYSFCGIAAINLFRSVSSWISRRMSTIGFARSPGTDVLP